MRGPREPSLPSMAEDEEYLVAGAERDTQSESEVVVAIFRTVLVLVVLFAPPLTRNVWAYSPRVQLAVIAASIYSLLVSLALYYRVKLRYHRQFVLIVDILLMTFLIYQYTRGEEASSDLLFPLYYLMVIVGAIWFNVAGALLAAAFSSFCFLLMLFLAEMYFGGRDITTDLVQLLSVNIPLLFLVAMLSGFMAEAWELEHERWTQAQLIIAEFRQQIRLARRIQELLLPPEVPTVAGLDIGFRTRPAKVVGGDYYDVLPLDNGDVAVCVADVAGKSVPGQLRLPMFKYALRACAMVFNTPARTLTRLNNMLCQELQVDMFISMAYCTFRPPEAQVRYANAGHMPVLVFHRDRQQCRPLRWPGIVLGVEPDIPYQEQALTLSSEDFLILYTDGLVEATNEEGEEFGLERLAETVRRTRPATAQELADVIFETVEDFEVGEKRDDLTVLVVRWQPPEESKDENSARTSG
ncbi:MAG TPA: hypothetical protein EYP85_06600 [Armatimonadetes bacterium]|nr:hypothetical protein [Armatimonadota bacterium]